IAATERNAIVRLQQRGSVRRTHELAAAEPGIGVFYVEGIELRTQQAEVGIHSQTFRHQRLHRYFCAIAITLWNILQYAEIVPDTEIGVRRAVGTGNIYLGLLVGVTE